MAYALVSAGTAATGTTSVSPTFGATTGSGHLLVAWVAKTGANAVTESVASGWTRAVTVTEAVNGVTSEIWFKPNSGASETAPVFSSTSATFMEAALAEFSGGDTSLPSDQTGSGSGTVSPVSATCGSADTASGELVITSDCLLLSMSGTTTSADSYNNGATPTGNLNSDATSTAMHYRFAYGVTTGNSGADSNSFSGSSAKSLATTIASFKAASSAATFPHLSSIPFMSSGRI